MTGEVEHCPICKRACPEYEYNPDPFWHDKTICKECGEKMPCYQRFEKALASGELQKELERIDREEAEKCESCFWNGRCDPDFTEECISEEFVHWLSKDWETEKNEN